MLGLVAIGRKSPPKFEAGGARPRGRKPHCRNIDDSPKCKFPYFRVIANVRNGSRRDGR
jgi:hypothetical protein